jgi:uridine phosphorylase
VSAWYLQCDAQDVAERVILVGDHARIALAQEVEPSLRPVSQNREFHVFSGQYRGVPITMVATGMGAPALTVAVEELVELGARQLARIGTTMAIDDPLGTMVLAQAACRFEGTSSTYVPLAVPAVPDGPLYARFREALATSSRPWVEGLVASFDGFYSQMQPRSGRPTFAPSIETLRRWGVAGMDMESASLFVSARVLGVAAVSLCAATVSTGGGAVEAGERHDLERDLVRTALAALVATRNEEREGATH